MAIQTEESYEDALKLLGLASSADINLNLQAIRKKAKRTELSFPMGSYFDDFSTGKISRDFEVTTGKRHPAGYKPYTIIKENNNDVLRVEAIAGLNVQNECLSGFSCSEIGSFRQDKFELRYNKKIKTKKPFWYGFRVKADESYDFEKMDSYQKSTFTQVKFREPDTPVLGLHWAPNNSMTITGSRRGKWDNKDEYHSSMDANDFYSLGKYFSLLGASVPLANKEVAWESQSTALISPPFITTKWTAYKIGVSVTPGDKWIEIFQNGKLIYRYEGNVYDVSSRYYETVIAIGMYRTYNPLEYAPKHALLFDDFVVTGSEFVVDGYQSAVIEELNQLRVDEQVDEKSLSICRLAVQGSEWRTGAFEVFVNNAKNLGLSLDDCLDLVGD